MMKIKPTPMGLHLILTQHWYDEIESGYKTVEYRDNTPFWRRRILNHNWKRVIFHAGFRNDKIMIYEITSIIPGEQSPSGKIEIHLGTCLSRTRYASVAY